MTVIAVRCQEVSKNFGPVRAVDGVSLAVPEGSFLALLGPSGCGKTTTLRLLAGFEIPDAGEIEIGGRLVNANGRHVPPEQRRVGLVFQEYALFPHLNVADNVAYGLAKGVDKNKRVHEILSLVGLDEVKTRLPHELSGGQQQRVALARALAPQPALILLDEPFSNLDAGLRRQIRAEVRQILRQAQATAIFVTHDQEEAFSLADQVAVMLAGRIIQVDAPQMLYRQPLNRQVATFLGHANFLPGQASEGWVTCDLGHLPTFSSNTGPVEVMLRPENVALQLNPASQAKIVDCEYFGHDQLFKIRLPSGEHLYSRLLDAAGDFQPGQRVDLNIRDKVMVYPIEGNGLTRSA